MEGGGPLIRFVRQVSSGAQATKYSAHNSSYFDSQH